MNRTILRAAILVLASATALIHWWLLLGFFDIPFLLNGLGYFALLGAFFLPWPVFANRRGLVHAVFIGYTVVTILAWVAIGERSAIGYVDKVVEVLLLDALVLHWLLKPRRVEAM